MKRLNNLTCTASFILLIAILSGCDPLARFTGTVYRSPLLAATGMSGILTNASIPLADATIKLFRRQNFSSSKKNLAIVSNGDGKFEIAFIGDISRNGYLLQISKPGYQTKEIDLSSDFRDSTTEVRSCRLGWVCVEIFAVLAEEN